MCCLGGKPAERFATYEPRERRVVLSVDSVIAQINNLCHRVSTDVCTTITCAKCPITKASMEVRKMKNIVGKGEASAESNTNLSGTATGYNSRVPRCNRCNQEGEENS